MKEDYKKLQSLDLEHLKIERQSLIKCNYAYAETIGRMEIEISDLKAMLQALEYENKSLNFKLTSQESNKKEFIETIDELKKQLENQKTSENEYKNPEADLETEDLKEEVSELREEILYLKGQYIPKLEIQLENARMLINELESELSILTKENEDCKSQIANNLYIKNPIMQKFSNLTQKKDFLLPESSTQYLKEHKVFKMEKSKSKTPGYVPSIKRIEKNSKIPEYVLNLSKLIL